MIDHQMLQWGLEELSDREMQLRLWAGHGRDNERREMSSFVEAVNHVFTDAGLSKYLAKHGQEGGTDAVFFQLALQLDTLVGKVPEELDAGDLVDSTEMDAVRSVAVKLLEQVTRD